MLRKNIDLEPIAEYTELTIAEIQALQAQQQESQNWHSLFVQNLLTSKLVTTKKGVHSHLLDSKIWIIQ